MRATTKVARAFRRASDNHDLLTTADLLAEDLSSRQIGRLVTDGVLERVIRGLYRRPGTRTPIQDIAAAVQRHEGAVASHVSALFLHGFDVDPPDRPHFKLPPGSAGTTRLGVQHRSPLDTVDLTRRRGLPVTSIARSFVDGAESLSTDALAAVANEMFSGKRVRFDQVGDALARVEDAPGRVGGGRVRAVMASWCDAIQPDSPAEAAAIRRILSFGLPAPATQYAITDGDRFIARVDMAWPDERVVREYDSFEWHRPDRVEADETRRQRIEALGWRIDAVHRHDLGAGEHRWLHALRDDLRQAARRAS
ncbi:type IV toxin-antitoxin system AbiEi family antitoxin domain-containing protein [Actinospongicola halichondriae]|uniref:type IV toxin-antitoxin system AbiEi family antitoxin domain-containing protein n=1 Tax=Actinospongicola halichondriae TaxID=3236844 RepID=UPI003D58DA17